jgi:hypothetical protein
MLSILILFIGWLDANLQVTDVLRLHIGTVALCGFIPGNNVTKVTHNSCGLLFIFFLDATVHTRGARLDGSS